MTFKDIEAQIILSELQLAAALFEEAAETSLALLRSLSGEDREQRSRCSFVLQQSFFELGRWDNLKTYSDGNSREQHFVQAVLNASPGFRKFWIS